VDCLHCGKKINALRKFHDGEFCSAAHRKAHLKKQNEDAVDFLIQSSPRRRLRAEAGATVGAPALSAEPQPIPVAAGFLAASITPQRLNHAPWRNAKPVCAPIHVRLPHLACIPVPSPCASRFINTTFEGRVEQGNAKPALMNPVEFAVRPPVLRVAVTSPVWIESAKPASPERPSAPYVRFRPNWARAVLRPASTPTTLPFAAEPALVRVDIAPLSLAFRLARPLQPPVTATSAPPSARERNVTRWRLTAEVLSKPKAAIVPPPPRASSSVSTWPAPCRGFGLVWPRRRPRPMAFGITRLGS
jgi:hypothetical protein